MRFIRDRLGHFYPAIPRQVAKRDENQSPQCKESFVALDPGVRTFQTTYDVNGLVTEWGKDDMRHFFRLCRIADKIQATTKLKKAATRRSTKKAWHRVL